MDGPLLIDPAPIVTMNRSYDTPRARGLSPTHAVRPPASSPPQWPDVTQIPGTWWVACTKPRQEEAFSADLVREGIPSYTPRTRKVIHHARQTCVRPVPLFPSYVFFAGDLAARYAALMTARLMTILQVADQPKFVRQLRAVQLALRENPEIGLYEGVVPGCQCVIVGTHNMRGQQGWCERVETHGDTVTVVLRIDVLGSSVALEFERKFVEVL